ncbi:MAG: hypothetical protein ACLFUF_05040 [Opitutales bacterium]
MTSPEPHDSLDRRIDRLLSDRPLPHNPEFTRRVLASIPAQEQRQESAIARVSRLALPLAALFIFGIALAPLITPDGNETASTTSPELSEAEIREIFLLEEGLPDRPLTVEQDASSDENLMESLEALYLPALES